MVHLVGSATAIPAGSGEIQRPSRALELGGQDNGGASRDRTDDLIVANDALSQLSYSPT